MNFDHARVFGYFTDIVNRYSVILPILLYEEVGLNTAMIKDVYQRIEKRLKAVGLKESAAATQAGLSDSAIRNMRRAVEAEKWDAGVSSRTIQLLAPVLKTTASWLLDGIEPEEIEPTSNLNLSIAPIGYVKVTGRVAANSWMSVDEMDFGYEDTEMVPSIGGYPAEWQFGLIVTGNCLNKIAQDGDRLVCLDIIKSGADILPDDLVIVERSRFEGQMIERTAKRVRKTADGYELWPESNDPAHQEPIKLHSATETADIRIIGKVLWILRKP